MSDTALNYQQLLTETLQSQMVILGPTITLAKAKNIPGLHVENDGRVTAIDGNPQEVSIKLLEQFRELSPLMVKKTMRPLLNAILTAYPKSEQTDTEGTLEQTSDQQEVHAPPPQEPHHAEEKSIDASPPHEEQKHENQTEHPEAKQPEPQQPTVS